MASTVDTSARWSDLNKDPPWYSRAPPVISDTAKRVLTQYARIPESEIEDHVYKIREQAWNVCPYPCVGTFNFVAFDINALPNYPDVIRRLKAGASFIDIGCGIGQDLRLLVTDGAPSTNLWGTDLSAAFYAVGYDLLLDSASFSGKFIEASFPEDISTNLAPLIGKMSIVHSASFLHLFEMEQQLAAGAAILRLLDLTSSEGGLVVGRQAGTTRDARWEQLGPAGGAYRHSVESIAAFWHRVAGAAGRTATVKATLREYPAGKTSVPGGVEPWCMVLYGVTIV